MFQITDKISSCISKICSWISGTAVLLLMLEVILDVALRKIAGSGLSGGFEYAQLLMVFLIFFALAHTQEQKATVHVTFFLVRFKGRMRFVVWAFGMFVALVTSVLFTWGCYAHGMLLKKVGTKFATTLIPFWPLYLLGAVTFALFTFVLLFDTLKSFAAIVNSKYAEEIEAEWVS